MKLYDTPLAPNPRRETPWLVGLATRLDDRRNSANPGTWRSMSSSMRLGLACTSSGLSKTALPGRSESFISVRVADTMTCSSTPAGWSKTLNMESPPSNFHS